MQNIADTTETTKLEISRSNPIKTGILSHADDAIRNVSTFTTIPSRHYSFKDTHNYPPFSATIRHNITFRGSNRHSFTPYLLTSGLLAKYQSLNSQNPRQERPFFIWFCGSFYLPLLPWCFFLHWGSIWQWALWEETRFAESSVLLQMQRSEPYGIFKHRPVSACKMLYIRILYTPLVRMRSVHM